MISDGSLPKTIVGLQPFLRGSLCKWVSWRTGCCLYADSTSHWAWWAAHVCLMPSHSWWHCVPALASQSDSFIPTLSWPFLYSELFSHSSPLCSPVTAFPPHNCSLFAFFTYSTKYLSAFIFEAQPTSHHHSPKHPSPDPRLLPPALCPVTHPSQSPSSDHPQPLTSAASGCVSLLSVSSPSVL